MSGPPADESDVISALSALANQAGLQVPSAGQSAHDNELFVNDRPSHTSPSHQLLLHSSEYTFDPQAHHHDHHHHHLEHDDPHAHEALGRETEQGGFDPDALLADYFPHDQDGLPEGGLEDVVSEHQGGMEGSGSQMVSGEAGGEGKISRSQKLSLQPFAGEWVKANYKLHSDHSVPRDVVYKSYTIACERQGLKPLNTASFGKSVKASFPDGVIKMRRLGERGKSRYHYTGLKPSNEREVENVRRLTFMEDRLPHEIDPSSQMRAPHDDQLDPHLDESQPLTRGSLDKGKRRATSSEMDDGQGSPKRSRQDERFALWAGSTQEAKYAAALATAFDEVREVVPALKASKSESHAVGVPLIVDGIPTPKAVGRLTVLNLARDYIYHLQQERLGFMRERLEAQQEIERRDAYVKALEEFFAGGGSVGEMADWKAEWERAQDQREAEHLADHLGLGGALGDPFHLGQLDQTDDSQHDVGIKSQQEVLAQLEAFARDQENVFGSQTLDDHLRSIHQAERDQQNDRNDEPPTDASSFDLFTTVDDDPTGSFVPPSSPPSVTGRSQRTSAPTDTLALTSALASDPLFESITTGETVPRKEEVRKERRSTRQTRYQSKLRSQKTSTNDQALAGAKDARKDGSMAMMVDTEEMLEDPLQSTDLHLLEDGTDAYSTDHLTELLDHHQSAMGQGVDGEMIVLEDDLEKEEQVVDPSLMDLEDPVPSWMKS